jgi:hypothetical protein
MVKSHSLTTSGVLQGTTEGQTSILTDLKLEKSFTLRIRMKTNSLAQNFTKLRNFLNMTQGFFYKQGFVSTIGMSLSLSLTRESSE